MRIATHEDQSRRDGGQSSRAGWRSLQAGGQSRRANRQSQPSPAGGTGEPVIRCRPSRRVEHTWPSRSRSRRVVEQSRRVVIEQMHAAGRQAEPPIRSARTTSLYFFIFYLVWVKRRFPRRKRSLFRDPGRRDDVTSMVLWAGGDEPRSRRKTSSE